MPSLDFIDTVIKNNPVLPAKEQLSLVKKWQHNSNKVALDQLVLSNMKIISREASKIKSRNYYISYEDLMQEGIAGMLKAASMFDTDQDVAFLTYAMWWIKANMKRYVMDYRSVVKMGTTRDDAETEDALPSLWHSGSDRWREHATDGTSARDKRHVGPVV